MDKFKTFGLTKRYGIDDLISTYPYQIDEWNRSYIGRFGVTEEEYLENPQAYADRANAENEKYIADLKEKGLYGVEFVITIHFRSLPEFNSPKPVFSNFSIMMPKGILGTDDDPKI